MSAAEAADERRFVRRMIFAAVALQLAGGVLALGLMMRRHHPIVGGVPPIPRPPAQTGAIDVRSE
jgi:hypothetical protein